MTKKYILNLIGETPISTKQKFHTEAENMEKAWYNLVENTPLGQKYSVASFNLYDATKDGQFLNNQFLL